MKYLLIIILLSTTACKLLGGEEEVETEAKLEPTINIIGQENLQYMDDGLYVKDGNAHPFNGGDIIEITGTDYIRTTWINGVLVIEEGTIDFRQELTINLSYDLSAENRIYENFAIFSPTSYDPSNCGYLFDEYEQTYEYEPNGNVATQNAYLDDSIHVQAVGWTLDSAWADANLTYGCL